MSDRAQINSLLESISGLALRIGLVLLGLGLVYAMYLIFGGKLQANLSAADKVFLGQSVTVSRTMLLIGGIAVIVSVIIRCFTEETIGVIMTLAGGALYFLVPRGMDCATAASLHSNADYVSLVQPISIIGLVCFIPGCLLLVRDLVLQIGKIGKREAAPSKKEDKASRAKPRGGSGIYQNCWNMAACNERVKRVCPAWEKKRSCWTLKQGCLCDQDVIRRGLVERDREQGGQDLTHAQKVDTAPKVILTAQQKKDRCRACTIYAEHQRQKFRIVSPITILAVLAIYLACYSSLSAWMYDKLKWVDHFLGFAAVKNGKDSFSTQGGAVTTLAMIVLGVVLLSIALKLVEYVIHDLQV